MLQAHFICHSIFQVIISVAQLIGNVVALNNHRFQESLALINSYATTDKSMVSSPICLSVCLSVCLLCINESA